MRSIQLQSALHPLHYSQPKHTRKQLRTPKLLPCLLSNEPIRLLGTSQRQQFSHLQGQTKAMLSGGGGGAGNHLVLGLASPAANSPDVSTFILIRSSYIVLALLENLRSVFVVLTSFKFCSFLGLSQCLTVCFLLRIEFHRAGSYLQELSV